MPENNLLNHLIKSGITPSFSFPLDVAEFRGEGRENYQRKVWPKMGTDLKLALSQYSPGKRLTVDGVDYEVKGLYIYGATDGVNRAETHFSNKNSQNHIKYYNRCRADRCGWVSKVLSRPDLHDNCPVCDTVGSVETGIWYRPDGFAPQIVPWGNDGHQKLNLHSTPTMKAAKPPENENEFEPSGAVEFPAPLTDGKEADIKDYNFHSDVKGDLTPDEFNLLRGVFERTKIRSTIEDKKGVELLLINSGYRGNGYFICQLCGYIALRRDDPAFMSGDGHHRPYAPDPPKGAKMSHPGKMRCQGDPFIFNEVYDTVYLGMTFRTDMFMLSLDGTSPFLQETSLANQRAFNNALTSLKEALISEVQKSEKLVNREINGGVRKRSKLDSDDNRVNVFEIFLYDDVSGGAGLSSSILTNRDSWTRFVKILKSTEERLTGKYCIDDNGCGKACIGCLFDFRNKKDHHRFDRRNGLRLIRYILYGTIPSVESGSYEGGDEDLRSLAHLLDENLNMLEAGVTLEARDGCIIAQKNGMAIHIRPRISYIDPFDDEIIKKWLENDYEFYEEINDVENSDSSYVHLTYQKIIENPQVTAEEIAQKIGGRL